MSENNVCRVFMHTIYIAQLIVLHFLSYRHSRRARIIHPLAHLAVGTLSLSLSLQLSHAGGSGSRPLKTLLISSRTSLLLSCCLPPLLLLTDCECERASDSSYSIFRSHFTVMRNIFVVREHKIRFVAEIPPSIHRLINNILFRLTAAVLPIKSQSVRMLFAPLISRQCFFREWPKGSFIMYSSSFQFAICTYLLVCEREEYLSADANDVSVAIIE